MSAIILGANGQDGYYLNMLLKKAEVPVVGVSRSGDFARLDLTDFDAVNELIRRVKPQYIFHLAATSTTKHIVWKENHDTISTGTLNILEATYRSCPETKVFVSGSGLQFKNEDKPIRETDEFAATSQYSVSRIHSVYAARYYRSLGIKAYVGYFFNHESARRSESHISSRIIQAVKRIQHGSREKILIGDPAVRKEWGYAGDMMEGIWSLVCQDKVFEATIGTGEAYSIKNWIDLCFKLIALPPDSYVETLPDFTSEYKVLVSNPETIHSLGWRHQVSFEELATKMLAGYD